MNRKPPRAVDRRAFRAERRRLSSSVTWLYRLGPLLGVIGLVSSIGLFSSGNAGTGAPAGELGARELLVGVIGVALIATAQYIVGRLMIVDLSADAFVVSGWRRTISIPIRDVRGIGGSRLSVPDYLWLDLRRPSEFGSRIYFFPRVRLFHFFSRHPLVEELKIIVERGAALDSELAVQSAARLAIRAIAVRTVAFLVFSGVLGAVVIGGVRSSDPYREAVAAVRDSASSRRLLGAPVNPGWYVTGYVEGVSSHGRAKLRFPVSGPRSEGTVRLSASRKGGVWVFSVLELQVDGRSIDLLRP